MKKLLTTFLFVTLLFLIFNPAATADENVGVTVPPHASDFQFNFASDGQTTVPQNTTLSYTITYGAKPSAGVDTTTTIVADYSSDKARDNSDVLDYVIGSASNGYNSTQPVVDLTNKTITWTISNLPAGTTDQEVAFQLKTNSNYTGVDPVTFTVRAKMNNQYVTLPDQTINQTYQFNQALVTPTPTPTQIPTQTPTTQPAPTSTTNQSSNTNSPTPTPTSIIPTITPTSSPTTGQITNISFPTISQSSATIEADTSTPSKVAISYGTSPDALNKTVSTNNYDETNDITLTNLTPDTTYYFEINATDVSGQTIISEIFEFQTAKQSAVSPINGIAVLTSNGNVLLSEPIYHNSSAGFALLPDNTNYDLTVTFSQPVAVTSLEAIEQNQLPIATVSFVQTQPGVYVAHLKTFDSGTYQLFLKTTDSNGNVGQQKILDLKALSPLRVYDKDSGMPINNARLSLYYYDSKTNSYQPLSQALFGTIQNPLYTDSLGQVALNIPAGKYRASASALLYDGQTVDFTLGPLNGEEFPQISLKKNPTNVVALLINLKNLFIDTATMALHAIHLLSVSVGLFTASAVTVTGAFVTLSYFLLIFKAHLTFKKLPIFFLFGLDMLLRRHTQKYIFGQITDEQNNPISRVLIEIESVKTKNILAQSSTHKTGKFYFSNAFTNPITLIFTKEGYQPTTLMITNRTEIPKNGFQIKLIKGDEHRGSLFSSFIAGLEEGFGMLFEAFMVVSIILEVLFFLWYGFEKTIPFFAFSLINIFLWIFYLREKK